MTDDDITIDDFPRAHWICQQCQAKGYLWAEHPQTGRGYYRCGPCAGTGVMAALQPGGWAHQQLRDADRLEEIPFADTPEGRRAKEET